MNVAAKNVSFTGRLSPCRAVRRQGKPPAAQRQTRPKVHMEHTLRHAIELSELTAPRRLGRRRAHIHPKILYEKIPSDDRILRDDGENRTLDSAEVVSRIILPASGSEHEVRCPDVSPTEQSDMMWTVTKRIQLERFSVSLFSL